MDMHPTRDTNDVMNLWRAGGRVMPALCRLVAETKAESFGLHLAEKKVVLSERGVV